VAITAGGTIVVSDLSAFGTGGLIAVNPGTGQQTKVPASTVFFRPIGIAADGSGQVVVAYLGQPGGVDGKVMRVNPVNGEFHAVAPTVQFLTPAGVAVDQGGNVYVADIDISENDSRLHHIGVLAPSRPWSAARR
jgi:DNA-binding beta-propeller fold protein YncE